MSYYIIYSIYHVNYPRGRVSIVNSNIDSHRINLVLSLSWCLITAIGSLPRRCRPCAAWKPPPPNIAAGMNPGRNLAANRFHVAVQSSCLLDVWLSDSKRKERLALKSLRFAAKLCTNFTLLIFPFVTILPFPLTRAMVEPVQGS